MIKNVKSVTTVSSESRITVFNLKIALLEDLSTPRINFARNVKFLSVKTAMTVPLVLDARTATL
jgi:hypothetical protein